MIRNEDEYREAVRRLEDQEARIQQQAAELRSMNLSKPEQKRVLDPIQSFHDQLQEEIASYERLKRGEFDEFSNFEGLGRLLIALRIAGGLTQRDLAERLEVSESQVSRDERNEYHGVTLDRANRILEVLNAEVRTTVVSSGKSSRR